MRDDIYEWRAVYSGYDPENPDTYLDEYDEQGNDVGFAAIDRARLTHLWLIPACDGASNIALRIPEGYRPVFYRQRFIETSMEAEQQETLPSFTFLGLQTTVHEGTKHARNVTMWVRIFEDGSILFEPGHNEI